MNDDLKEFYRENIRYRRMCLEPKELDRYGKDICDIVFNTGDKELDKCIKDASVFALYREVRGELPCKFIAERLMKNKKQVCYPKVASEELSFYYVEDMTSDFEEGSYGILEPKNGLTEVSLDDIDVLIVPAIAYNDEGVRLGQGGGYYDRLCSKLENSGKMPLIIGICYDFQINSGIPVEDHDMCVDVLLAVETGDNL